MALKINKQTDAGVEVADAYCKVESVNNLDKAQMIINITYSIDSESKPFFLERKGVPFNIDGTNPIQQGYLYLKTLPEFANSIDV